MAKGATYRLAEAEGCRRLCIPLSLWPALTGIISDNEFQFHPDCWAGLVQEVLNMPVCGSYGWDGADWYKLAMVWGYSDRWVETQSSGAGAAGIRTLTFDAVSAGEVGVLLAVDARNMNTDPSSVQIRVSASGVVPRLKVVALPGVGGFVLWSGRVVLREGDCVEIRFEGCALDDTLIANLLGYKMKVAEKD